MRWLLAILLAAPACAADLLIQGAVDWELQPLLAALQNRREVKVAAWTFWTGRIGGHGVVISRTDVGPINAAAATALGIHEFHPSVVINQGTAGAHNPDLNVYDIVVGDKTVDYGAFTSGPAGRGQGSDSGRWSAMPHRMRIGDSEFATYAAFPGDPAWVVRAEAQPYAHGRVVKGVIGSAYQYNREIDRILWLRRTYGSDTEDMESAYAAGVAVAMKTPFVAIRIVSDSEFSHPQLERRAGEYVAAFVAELVAKCCAAGVAAGRGPR
jgi:adenosylhomocysteine nucleosidase